MTAIDPPGDETANTKGGNEPRTPAKRELAVLSGYADAVVDPASDAAATPKGAGTPVVQTAESTGAEAERDQTKEDEQTVLRIEQLPRDIGWLMVYVGVLGVILPGIISAPFLIAGIAVLAPGGPQLLTRWVGRKPRGVVHFSLKQIGRWLDDLERRYPRLPLASS